MTDKVRAKGKFAAALLGGVLLLAGCKGATSMNETGPVNAVQANTVQASAFDWGNPGGEAAGAPQFARSQALCRAVRGHRPAAAQGAAAPAGCDAEALYYGIGVARDPARARACAAAQTPGDQMLEPFAGPALLMTIYANGQGTPRDLDAAIHLACTLQGATPADYDRRVTHLAALRDRHWQGTDFDYCDDVAGGLGEGLCASHRAALARPQREAALRGVIAHWSPAQRAAYEPLRRAFEEFVAASAAGDLAQGAGSAHASLRARLEQGLRDQFADMLQRLAGGRAPHFTAGQFRTEDLQLNQAYQARVADERQYDAPGITPDSIQNAQRAWLRYRDAFIAFAATAYPQVPRESIAAWLTRNRSEIIPGLASSL